MQQFGLTKYVNINYRITRLMLLETKVAILFNRICKQQLQKKQAKVTKTNVAIWLIKMCRSVIFYGIIVHLLVIVQNKKSNKREEILFS